VEHVFRCLLKVFVAIEFGERYFLREKVDFEDIAFGHGVFEVAFPAAVVLEGGSNVPTNLAVFSKGSSSFGG
jgi:hypothetical protein